LPEISGKNNPPRIAPLPRPDPAGFFLFDRLADVVAYSLISGRIGWPHLLREIVKMENPNFIPAETLDPRDQQIVNLESQLEHFRRRDQLKAEQLDQLGDVIMGVIGDKMEAVIDSRVGDLVETALNEFNIRDYEYEIGDMIDDRLPEGLDEESRSDDLKAAIKEVLSSATLTMDIE
jgi:hypothetical protein